MKFGPVALEDAEGAILAHGRHAGGKRISKGTVLGAEELALLRSESVTEIVVARLAPGDVDEDAAAARLAAVIMGAGVTATTAHTGRVNLHAAKDGLLVLDVVRLEALNQLSEAVTVATLPAWESVQPGRMAATIKIIPFAVSESLLRDVEALAAGGPLLRVEPYTGSRAWLIQTYMPHTKQTVLDKTVDVTRARLGSIGAQLTGEARVGHDEKSLSQALLAPEAQAADMVLVVGASAIVDRGDVVPSAVARAGGDVLHFGMPVDPGNLMLLGRVNKKPIVGLPGCGRSPKLNGVDWVLQRLSAGMPLEAAHIRSMGVGGLLTEITDRPSPRILSEPAVRKPYNITPVILAAGMSRRMGPTNKLLEPVRDAPMLRRVAEQVASAGLGAPLVVLGHEADQVRDVLYGFPARFVVNPSYEQGLSASLKAGIAALDENVDAALICLGDMPRVGPDDVRAVADGFDPMDGAEIVLPVHKGKRGNPVLFSRRFFAEILEIQGDVGARHLIGAYSHLVREVDRELPGILLDIDTPEALQKYRNREV